MSSAGTLALIALILGLGPLVFFIATGLAIPKTKKYKEHEEETMKIQEQLSRRKPYEPLNADGVPTNTSGLLFVLDGFTKATEHVTPDTEAAPRSSLPAPYSIVENSLIEILDKLRDPVFRDEIKERWSDHRYILTEQFHILLSRNLELNLSNFVDDQKAQRLNHLSAEIEKARRYGLTPKLEQLETVFEFRRARMDENEKIAARLRSRGLSTMDSRATGSAGPTNAIESKASPTVLGGQIDKDAQHLFMAQDLVRGLDGIIVFMWEQNREHFPELFHDFDRAIHDSALISIFLAAGIRCVSAAPPSNGFDNHLFIAKLISTFQSDPGEVISRALEAEGNIKRLANQQYLLDLEKFGEDEAKKLIPERQRFSCGFVFFRLLNQMRGTGQPEFDDVFQAAMTIGGIVTEHAEKWHLAIWAKSRE